MLDRFLLERGCFSAKYLNDFHNPSALPSMVRLLLEFHFTVGCDASSLVVGFLGSEMERSSSKDFKDYCESSSGQLSLFYSPPKTFDFFFCFRV